MSPPHHPYLTHYLTRLFTALSQNCYCSKTTQEGVTLKLTFQSSVLSYSLSSLHLFSSSRPEVRPARGGRARGGGRAASPRSWPAGGGRSQSGSWTPSPWSRRGEGVRRYRARLWDDRLPPPRSAGRSCHRRESIADRRTGRQGDLRRGQGWAHPPLTARRRGRRHHV